MSIANGDVQYTVEDFSPVYCTSLSMEVAPRKKLLYNSDIHATWILQSKTYWRFVMAQGNTAPEVDAYKLIAFLQRFLAHGADGCTVEITRTTRRQSVVFWNYRVVLKTGNTSESFETGLRDVDILDILWINMGGSSSRVIPRALGNPVKAILKKGNTATLRYQNGTLTQ